MGKDGGVTGVDDDFAARGVDGIGARFNATEAANGKDVRIGGGVATIRRYLQAGLINELHLAVAPVLLGSGENLFAGIDLPNLGYQCTAGGVGPGDSRCPYETRVASSAG
jgi:dihydrofolate reductase